MNATATQPTQPTPPTPPPTKKLVIVCGRGTANEQCIETDVTLYWCARAGRYVAIPAGEQ
jgi:hypothetical protein